MEKFQLPQLPYEYDALEPHIDVRTMKIHHQKHHQAYTDKLNMALEKHQELFNEKAENLLRDLNKIPKEIRTAVRNNGGGYVNHNFFWKSLSPNKQEVPKDLMEKIEKDFGTFEKFKEMFITSSNTHFGSGWVWLVLINKKLEIISTPNQDSPLSEGKIPLLCIDVWEHAYYLKYQNKRPDYVNAFFNIINWKKLNDRLNVS